MLLHNKGGRMGYSAYLNGKRVATNLKTPLYNFTGLEPATEYAIQFSSDDSGIDGELSEPIIARTREIQVDDPSS